MLLIRARLFTANLAVVIKPRWHDGILGQNLASILVDQQLNSGFLEHGSLKRKIFVMNTRALVSGWVNGWPVLTRLHGWHIKSARRSSVTTHKVRLDLRASGPTADLRLFATTLQAHGYTGPSHEGRANLLCA